MLRLLPTFTSMQQQSQLHTFGQDWQSLEQPVFELFFWERIIFDEFHELEAMDRRRAVMLSHLRSRYRWGVTGTPPVRDMVQIVDLAKMLRIQVGGDSQTGEANAKLMHVLMHV